MNQTVMVALAAGVAVFVLYLLTLGIYWWRQRMRLNVIFFRGIAIALLVGVSTFTIYQTQRGSYNVLPLSDWWRISEIGYIALWMRVARTGVLFAAVGFLFPFGFRKMNGFGKMLIFAVAAALALGVGSFALGRFDVDDVIYAFWGILVGFALLCVVAGLIPRLKVFVAMGFGKNAYVIGAVLVMVTFFIGVGTLFANNGPTYTELQFAQSEPLPDDLVVSTSLSAERVKMPVYEFVEIKDIATEAERVAQAMGLDGAAEVEGRSGGYASVQNGSKKLTVYTAGNWVYVDEAAEEAVGGIPDDNTVARLAQQVALNGAAQHYEVFDTTVESKESENGTIVGKQAWITGAVNGKRIIGSCEFKILVGPGGNIASVDKYDADFKQSGTQKIISSQEALDLIRTQGMREDGKQISVSHTLYSTAVSVNITQVDVAYWLEGAKGMLQPIWLFSATGTLEDGSSREFEIYVPAINYGGGLF